MAVCPACADAPCVTIDRCGLPLQLALDNALAPYFEKNFGFGITKAANLAAIFGMLNFIARPLGGYLSDIFGRRFGMRGRIAWLFFVVAGGGECLKAATAPLRAYTHIAPLRCCVKLRRAGRLGCA